MAKINGAWQQQWSAYIDLIYTRKEWLNDEYSGSKRVNRIDHHWYRSGAIVPGSVRWRKHRKPWKVWGWEK